MQDDKLVIPGPKRGQPVRRYGRLFFLFIVLLVAAGGGYWWFDSQDKTGQPEEAAAPRTSPEKASESSRQADSGSLMMPLHSAEVPSSTDMTGQREQAVAEDPSVQSPSSGEMAVTDTAQSGTETRFSLDSQMVTPDPSEGRQDDGVVSSRFIRDLARWMVQGYHPAHRGKGYLDRGLPAANMHYGISLKGFNWRGDTRTGRRDVLRYVFTPGMLNGLYRLYIDSFFREFDAAAAERGLSEQQVRNMCDLYAIQCRGLSGVLSGLADMSDISGRLAGLRKLINEVAEADTRYGMLVVESERARMEGDTDRARALDVEVNRAMVAYHQALQAKERGVRSFVSEVKRDAGAGVLDDSTILFVATWIERRLDSRQDVQAIQAAAEITAEFARRMSEKAHP